MILELFAIQCGINPYDALTRERNFSERDFSVRWNLKVICVKQHFAGLGIGEFRRALDRMKRIIDRPCRVVINNADNLVPLRCLESIIRLFLAAIAEAIRRAHSTR